MTMPDPAGYQRIAPNMPVTAYKTYQAVSPQAKLPKTAASCERSGCAAWTHGWRTIVDEASPLGQRQAAYIRGDRSRRHTETRREDGLTVFEFGAGQQCFGQHAVPREGAERFLLRGGDWRGTTSEPRSLPVQSWLDDFGEHQEKLANRLAEG